MARHYSLKEYRRKRNFSNSPEPRPAKQQDTSGRRFVIQKHDARQLHYDFRLEINGVLVSWAVPKGLSTDPRTKRLGIQTEDHPLPYADFEGVIPQGEYGAGTVMVWDQGTYRNLRGNARKGKQRRNMSDALKEGMLEIWLEGEKLQGGYAIKRIRNGDKPQWLIIKMKDNKADARRNPVSTEPDSVKTGRNLRQISTEQAGH
ncbi:MAG: DNA polymerase ligase N-terminal domain-containing protein [Gammaproteobacteria bacterium]|jgi:DNA ligase D-like protein (predicted 3'-phosphoesterase)